MHGILMGYPCVAIVSSAPLTALAAPWALGFSDNSRARNTFLVRGVFGLVGGLLSQTDEME